MTGFLGPNGAGKSTTMRLVLGLDQPDRGTATINGQLYAGPAPAAAAPSARCSRPSPCTRAGAPATTCCSWPRRRACRASRVDEVLDLVGLRDVADKRAGGFSLGMSQRLGIAAAMLGDPQVLLLDEPVNGLDPRACCGSGT